MKKVAKKPDSFAVFLEVNAGEAEGIGIGDNVVITGYTQPA